MKLFIFCLLVGVGLVFSFAFASELYIVPSPTPPTPTPVPWTWQQKIQEGMALLKSSPPALGYEYFAVQKRGRWVLTTTLLRKQIALAIFNTKNGAVFEKRVWVTQDAIDNYRKRPVGLSPVDANESLDIQPRSWNSFNTAYEVVGHPEMVVVANKYLIESKLIGDLPEKSTDRYTAVYYSPYSPALHQSELVETGRQYVEQVVDVAFADLLERKVITDPVSKEFVKTLMVVEHVDPSGFNTSEDGGKTLAERVLVVIGANQANAYRWTGSPAGANGLAQFIRPTYNTMVRNYPSAGLIRDYLPGMADHTNAVKAMALFFDAYKKEITAKTLNKNLVRQLGISEEMLAATYNGGPGRVTKSLNKFGASWLTAQIGLPKSSRIIAAETLNYLKKFSAIRQLDIF